MDISHIKSLDMALSVNMLYLQAMKKRENYDNLDLGVLIELDDGKIYRKALYLMVKTMVSCRFSLKPIQWGTWFSDKSIWTMKQYHHFPNGKPDRKSLGSPNCSWCQGLSPRRGEGGFSLMNGYWEVINKCQWLVKICEQKMVGFWKIPIFNTEVWAKQIIFFNG